MPEATAMHPDKAELFAPSWTASALRHQLAFLKVAFLKDTADKTRDELVELYWEALVARGVEHDAEARRWLLLPEELGPEEQAEAWVCLLADRPLEATPLQERLKSGTMLCALLEKVKPGSIKLKVASDEHLATLNENMANAKMRENIGQYVDGCADLGLPQRELFLTADLFENKNWKGVLKNIHGLARFCHYDVPGFHGPMMGKSNRFVAPGQLKTRTSDQVPKERTWVGQESGHPPPELQYLGVAQASLRRSHDDWKEACAAAVARLQAGNLDGRDASWLALALAKWWAVHAAGVEAHGRHVTEIVLPACATDDGVDAQLRNSIGAEHNVLKNDLKTIEGKIVQLLEAAGCTQKKGSGPLAGWEPPQSVAAAAREKKDDDRLELDGWPAAALRHQVAAMGGTVPPAGAAHGALASAYWEALKAKGWERDADKRRWLQLPAAESAKPEAAAAAWLHLLLDMEVPEAGYDEKKDEGAPLQQMLRSGTLLCALLEKIKPGAIKLKVASDEQLATMAPNRANAKMRENIGQYVDACAALGLPQRELFITADLFEDKNWKVVLKNIHGLARYCHKDVPGFKGPHMGKSNTQDGRARRATNDETNKQHAGMLRVMKGLVELSVSYTEHADAVTAQEATAAEGMAKALSWEEVMKVEAKVTAAMVESDVGLLFRSCDMEAKRAWAEARGMGGCALAWGVLPKTKRFEEQVTAVLTTITEKVKLQDCGNGEWW